MEPDDQVRDRDQPANQLAFLRRFVASPVFEDEEKTRIAGVLNSISLAVLGILAVIAALTPFVFDTLAYGLIATGLVALLMLGMRLLIRRGRVRLAGGLFAAALWLLDTLLIYASGGITGGVSPGYVAIAVLAGLLLGGYAAFGFAGLSAVTGLVLVYVEKNGLLPSPILNLTLDAQWLSLASNLALVAALLYLATNSLKEALERVRRQERALAEANEGLKREMAERERKEAELTQSEEKYRALVEQSLQGLVILQDRRVVFTNPAFADIAGYTVEELLAFSPEDVTARIHPEDQALVWGRFQDRLEGKTVSPYYEFRMFRKDGTVCWLDLSASRIEYEGQPAIQAALLDITERKRAEQALQESEARYRALFDQAYDAIIVENADEEILDANEAAVELFGYPVEELLTKSTKDLQSPELRARPSLPMYSDPYAAAGEHFETTIMQRDGTRTPVEMTVTPLEAGGQRLFMSIIRDITERKQAEAERERLLAQIREQARRVQQIIDTVPEGVLLLDSEERIIVANPVAETHLPQLGDARVGDRLARLGERPLAELLTAPPQGLWHEVSTNGRSFQVIARPVSEGAAQPEGSGGGLMDSGWVLVTRDVTQQREVERRVQQQERLAAVGQLAAGIAHDFNNIMATIVLYAQMTARAKEVSDVVRQRMETIDDQAAHASRLIQQILDFSRQAVLERCPLDLGILVKEHAGLLRRTLPESIDVELVLRPADRGGDDYTVLADPTRMQQMVTNLALNARDAMPEGGNLRIELERLEVRLGESPVLPEMEAGDWVVVTVLDTGMGISTDVMPRIFEPFFTTKAPLGSGLGLAQVHGIVGQHKGRITVDTEVGKGTTFTIYLPAYSPESSAAIAPKGPSTLPLGQGELILVVEDDAAVRQALVEGLGDLNYQAVAVANGREALAALDEMPPADGSPSREIALVLSDVVMPGMGGLALLHAVRERGLDIPVLMMTGHPLERELEDLREQGVIDWLSKPVALDELAYLIAQTLGA
jgi:two-component system cell cycle sensor histidine kinase/response regulator CckA